MCGIIGRISLDSNPIKTIKGLKELEYRGYDSYGILFSKNNKIIIQKDIGEICINNFNNMKSNIEIGHTRWATHGGVLKQNAHPHSCNKNEFHIVMNGIVENYSKIKLELEKEGYFFNSQTDTEVIVHLFQKYYVFIDNIEKSLIFTLKKVLNKLEGEFSFLLKYSNYILGYKNINPIIVGKSENEFFISSDLNLVQKNSNKYFILNDDEFFISNLLENNININLYNLNLNLKKIDFVKSNIQETIISKNTKYFMEKEIYEQREIKNVLTQFNLKSIDYLLKKIKNSSKIFISAAGTSYHAAIYLHYKLLSLGIFSSYILASELKNYINIINKNDLIIIFSQSGETADLIYPLKEINSEIFTITNTKNSTLDRLAINSIYLNCGKEVAVASTKAFTFQLMVSEIISSRFSEKQINLNEFKDLFDKTISLNNSILDEISSKFKDVNNLFYLGRNENFPLALEGALKLKEISYIHAEGFAGGELKHGSLALIENGVGAVIFGSDNEILSNGMEIKTRGGIIIGIGVSNSNIFDYFLKVPSEFEHIFSSILMQLLAFKITLLKKLNPDKPRNLAKSVTVK